jgi:membrane protease YdiL (CAAX protease family)
LRRWARRDWLLGTECAAGALALGLSIFSHRLVPPRLHTPAGLASGVLTVMLARGSGMTWEELGLSPRDAPRGTLAGIAAAAVLGTVTLSGLLVPRARHFYFDDRIVNVSLGRMMHEVFVRIPLGTALPEELVFRGALLGLLARRRSSLVATVASSVLFGLWHILPTIDRIESNPGTRHAHGDHLRMAAVVAATCTATTAGGLCFAWLRLRSGSVVAPILAHVTPNATGFLGGWVLSRLVSPSQAAERDSTRGQVRRRLGPDTRPRRATHGGASLLPPPSSRRARR